MTVAIYSSVIGVGILAFTALITAIIYGYRRRQRTTQKFDLQEKDKNQKTEVVEMIEEGIKSPRSPFAVKVPLSDGAGGLDNVYALKYDLGNVDESSSYL